MRNGFILKTVSCSCTLRMTALVIFRRGPEASDWEVSLDDEHLRAYPHLVADAKTLLAHREAGILDHAPLARR
jgi:hypothetical protein